MRCTAHAASLLVALAGAGGALAQGASVLEESGTLTDRYLTVGEVRDVLHAANGAFQACFLGHAGARDPGEVTLRFAVGRDGLPVDVQLEVGEDLADLGACLAAEAGRLEYDAHDGDPMQVAYPVVFVRDDRGPRTVPYPIVFVRPRVRAFLWIHVPPSADPETRDLLSNWLYP